MREDLNIDARLLGGSWRFGSGIYNICWGLYSALDPQWLFRFVGMTPANYPQIFACLGVVIGLYGVLYLEVDVYAKVWFCHL